MRLGHGSAVSDDHLPDDATPLRRLRAKLGLTQQQLADLLERARTQVSAWEYGRGMTLKSRAYVASKLGVEPDELGPPYDPETPRPHQRGPRTRRGPLRDGQALINPRRESDTDLHRSGALSGNPDDIGVSSASPIIEGGAAAMHHDPEYFSALVQFWNAMTPEGRLELLGHARRLRAAALKKTPDFRIG